MQKFSHHSTRSRVRGACAVAIASVLLVAGCATIPKEDVPAPARKKAIGMKNLAVYPVKFAKNNQEDVLLTNLLESTIVNAELNNNKLFSVLAMNQLGDVAEQQRIERQALAGSFDQATVQKLKATGVEGLIFTSVSDAFSQRRYSIEGKKSTITCTEHAVLTTFQPKVVSIATARIVSQDSYVIKKSTDVCGADKVTGVNDNLSREAREEAVTEFRRDIAPYMESVQVSILSRYCKGATPSLTEKGMNAVLGPCDTTQPSAEVLNLVKSGKAFAKEGNYDLACEKWGEAASKHDEGFVAPYLQGLCAELHTNDLNAAKRYYDKAYSQIIEPVSAISEAKERIEAKKKGGSLAGARKVKAKPKSNPTVKKAQQILIDSGYDPGVADGFMGKKTAQALSFYQEDHGIPATGVIDSETKGIMGI